jgi:hypothetical protein
LLPIRANCNISLPFVSKTFYIDTVSEYSYAGIYCCVLKGKSELGSEPCGAGLQEGGKNNQALK